MKGNNEEVVDILIDGARYGDLEDVENALSQGVDVNAQDEFGRTALHMAAANGHEPIIKLLLGKGAGVTIANQEGNTALHWACVAGSLPAVSLLMEAGASASALNTHDQTPVDEALVRHLQNIVDTINQYNSPSKEGPDIVIEEGVEEEEDGDGGEMVVEGEEEDKDATQ